MFTSLFLISLLAACQTVTGSKILGSDLARADARLSALPATLIAGFTTAPGSSRVFKATEIQRLARANGLDLANPPELCFTIPLRQPDAAEVRAAVQRSLPAGASLEVVEMASTPVPPGELHFPVGNLEPPSAGSAGVQLWRGYVGYAENRKAPFWVRVRVAVTFTAVVATSDLEPGQTISAASVHLEARTGLINREQVVTRVEDVVGRAARRILHAGSVIPATALADAPAVRRGDTVTVEVRSGEARVHFDAIAEAAARAGDLVELRNPSTGKTFRARLESPSSAVIQLVTSPKL